MVLKEILEYQLIVINGDIKLNSYLEVVDELSEEEQAKQII